MPGLQPISWKNLIRRFRELGFDGPFSGGKHPFMVKDDLVITVPNPHRGDIGIELLKRILKQAAIPTKKWLK
jgi:predicted RNA binding protein YcfA (HicA-like mRNA interferase family)